MLNLLHYDKSSLLAGKLYAVLTRKYTKGRDIFDLFWYLSSPTWQEPNLIMLNNALRQTGWTGEVITKNNWRTIINQHLQTLDWSKISRDVEPFLEPNFDTQLLSQENLERVLLK